MGRNITVIGKFGTMHLCTVVAGNVVSKYTLLVYDTINIKVETIKSVNCLSKCYNRKGSVHLLRNCCKCVLNIFLIVRAVDATGSCSKMKTVVYRLGEVRGTMAAIHASFRVVYYFFYNVYRLLLTA